MTPPPSRHDDVIYERSPFSGRSSNYNATVIRNSCQTCSIICEANACNELHLVTNGTGYSRWIVRMHQKVVYILMVMKMLTVTLAQSWRVIIIIITMINMIMALWPRYNFNYSQNALICDDYLNCPSKTWFTCMTTNFDTSYSDLNIDTIVNNNTVFCSGTCGCSSADVYNITINHTQSTSVAIRVVHVKKKMMYSVLLLNMAAHKIYRISTTMIYDIICSRRGSSCL